MTSTSKIAYTCYNGEEEVPIIMELCQEELSEPYSIFTYRYFLKDWPHLCFFARDGSAYVGVIVCKQDRHKSGRERGYIAMLSVLNTYRKRGIASTLVQMALQAMIDAQAEEVVLETEADNAAALSLYEKFGFLREKRLYAFYLNRKDAFRLVLPLCAAPAKQDVAGLDVQGLSLAENQQGQQPAFNNSDWNALYN